MLAGSTASTEHPRARGENTQVVAGLLPLEGTSPRTRGKRTCVGGFYMRVRNIPAHAGKTGVVSVCVIIDTEHPRARGENGRTSRTRLMRKGTSPRTRGKRLLTCGSSFLGVILHSVLFFCTVGDSMESPCSSLLSECFSARIVVYGQLGTSLLSAYGCAFWWDGG